MFLLSRTLLTTTKDSSEIAPTLLDKKIAPEKIRGYFNLTWIRIGGYFFQALAANAWSKGVSAR